MSAELPTVLNLERLDADRFRGRNLDLGFPHVYGGQVLAQALIAARDTVADARTVHSMHAYFLRRGDHNTAIDYAVERTRDGNSFATRRVMACQNGVAIYAMCASFQVAEAGLEFAADLAGGEPGALPETAVSAAGVPANVPAGIWNILTDTFEVRVGAATGTGSMPRRQIWFRLAAAQRGERGLDHPYLAYLSDYGLLTAALLPHGLVEDHAKMRIASIDHALWFHRPVNLDEWVLFDCGPVSNSNARGLTHGCFRDCHGRLLATVMQEGLVRLL
ncbi:MAG: thioesterase family protein [Gammaproteobacteria bacterium]|nr:thioesterase family protein [Gammaproteobacteria bacterium]